MKPSVKSTNKYDQAQIGKGLVKVHIWIPPNKREDVIAYCKAAREEYFKLDGESGE